MSDVYIFSPLCFIIAVECLFRTVDIKGGKTVMGVWLDRLEYADDAALVDVCCEAASERVTCFEACAKKHADMVVSRPKTEYMNVGLLQVDKRDIQQEEYDCKEWQHSHNDGLLLPPRFPNF